MGYLFLGHKAGGKCEPIAMPAFMFAFIVKENSKSRPQVK
jgi:hypothetical protein